MGLSKEAIQAPKKTRRARGNDVKVQLAYKSSSPEAEFRLFKALSMLLAEEDIFDYLRKSSGKEKEINDKIREPG